MVQDADGVDVVVVGGGVVGCAVASRAARAGHSVLLLEAGPRLGEGTTARNSGVIHSGLYNPPGWLKSDACVRGNARLYQWAQEHGVWHRKVGKLIVAQREAQRPALEELFANAQAVGARGCQLVNAAAALALEPSIPAVAAIFCTETGIVDPAEFTQSLATDAQAHGALVLTHAEVRALELGPGGWTLETARGPVRGARVVNCAGLQADRVAALAGVSKYRLYPCRGDYFRLSSRREYRHLVYPVKDKAHAGLGVHLTLERGGGYRLGPDAQYVDSKEDFRAAPEKLAAFHAAAQALLGPLEQDALRYDSCGIRPKLRGPADAAEQDFVVSEDRPGLINLVGIESPGLTSALDLAERVAAGW